ncbi:MAG: hypothetical protein H6712_23980 [Myxococcales bacterium]|nr:hypothetical protein [Myxococcales bacterium]
MDNTSTVVLRRSLVVSRGDGPEISMDCTDVQATFTVAETLLTGDGNVDLGDVDPSWFVNYNLGDLHLSATYDPRIALEPAAQPELMLDIDGEPRPDGAMDFAGADVP